MHPLDFRYLLEQYLDEQEISYKESDSLKYLCLKAAIEGYSFSDEMIKDFSNVIPDEEEIKKYK